MGNEVIQIVIQKTGNGAMHDIKLYIKNNYMGYIFGMLIFIPLCIMIITSPVLLLLILISDNLLNIIKGWVLLSYLFGLHIMISNYLLKDLDDIVKYYDKKSIKK